MDTRSDSSATQPENKIDRHFFQRQCAENKRKLLTAFQNQYDSTINHLTLSKEVKPFPVYSRPNLAFKPQLEDIKSSILMLNKKLYCAAEQNASHINERKRPKSVNETERRKQLNEVKKKFQSRTFFNNSKYEKIEGLNWVSWK